MTGASSTRATIVGGGLSGALMACYLGRAGYTVDVFESRPDPRSKGFVGGRSINLALSARGIDGLERVGLADAVLAGAVPMRGRMMHAADGTLTFQPYSKNVSEAINSVSRGGLNITVLKAADEYENVTLHFDKRCTSVDLDAPTIDVQDTTTEVVSRVESDFIIGADGAFSAVRRRLQRSDRFDYSQTYLSHGFKELTIPPVAAGEFAPFAMEPNALHIWPRGGYMMIALPNQDGSFTCTLFWPFAGANSFAVLKGDAAVAQYFEKQFGDAVPLFGDLLGDYRTNPTSSLVTLRCNPWHYRDKVVLIGDAAHAIVPFYGQGINAGFEDCVALDRCLSDHESNLAAAFEQYTNERKEHGDAIADLALKNFVEMRDSTASRLFLFKKKMEKRLHRWFPRSYTPLYNMVTFSTIPYAETVRKAVGQSRVILTICISAAVLIVLLIILLIIVIL